MLFTNGTDSNTTRIHLSKYAALFAVFEIGRMYLDVMEVEEMLLKWP